MNTKRAVQLILVVLFGFGVIVYIAAKVHFLIHYDPHREGGYLREHSVYWALMATIALLIWLVEKLLPEKPR